MSKRLPFIASPSMPGREHGLSLVELMVSLTLGLILMVGVGYVYMGSRTSFKQQDALSRMQENARYVFEVLSNDLRMTGFSGSLCGLAESEVDNKLDATKWYGNVFGLPVKGYENASTSAPDVSATVYAGDALHILHADSTREYVVSANAAPAAVMTFDAAASPADGHVVMSGCGNAKPRAAYAMAGKNNGLTTTILAKSRIYPLVANLYYVRLRDTGSAISSSNPPALYRRTGDGVTEELVEGVEDMQIEYGVDTSNPAVCSNNDGGVDTYVIANDVESTAPCATSAEDWKKVLSVRVKLTMRSTEDNVTTETVGGDKRLRKVFTTTIAIRNRL